MKRSVFLTGLLLLVTGALVNGNLQGRNRGTASEATDTTARKALTYACPMHPAYRSDRPGKAPCCGMDLEPVTADGGSNAAKAPSQPSTVPVDSAKQRVLGIVVSPVEKVSGSHVLRLFGRVVPDEDRVFRLNAGIDGYIREVSTVTTGSRVRKNQPLATFAAPNGWGVIQTYILNLGAQERFRQAAAEGSVEGQSVPAADANVQQRIDQMRNMGISAVQMQEIEKTRRIPAELRIVSPVNGIVLSRNVYPGLKFDRGLEWYRIADLSKVWVLADVFENEARYLRPGAKAKVSLSDGRTTSARVAEVLPQFDPATRTMKARLEVDNPGDLLRPEMFVDVELAVTYAPTIAVPLEAVLDSGLRRTVFVESSEGAYEPRVVKTGWRRDGRIEIVEGLVPGERIVESGTFFLDSESRMKLASASPGAEGRS